MRSAVFRCWSPFTDRQTDETERPRYTRSVTIGRIYIAFHENVAVILCQQLYQILTDFKNSFIVS